MSDEEGLPQPVGPPPHPFAAERSKTGRARCKRCKQPCAAGELRMARFVPNNFSTSGGYMKAWHHPQCLWDVFSRQRASTRKIEDPEQDIEGWLDLPQEDMDLIVEYLRSTGLTVASPKATRTAESSQESTPKQRKRKASAKNTPASGADGEEKKKRPRKKKGEDADAEPSTTTPSKGAAPRTTTPAKKDKPTAAHSAAGSPAAKKDKPTAAHSAAEPPAAHRDECFREFRRLCVELSEVPSYLAKTALIKKMITEGSDGDGFKGDLLLWVRMLLPMAEKKVYNLQSKQLVKLFSRMFQTSEESMLEHLEQGDVADTIQVFFEQSSALKPRKKSVLTMLEVDEFLEQLSTMTREEEQSQHFSQMAKRCTSNDLKVIIRLVKHDLRINAGPKHVLEAVHPDAYAAFQASRDIRAVVQRALGQDGDEEQKAADPSSPTKKATLDVNVKILTPVLPMLAEACKSVEQAMKKCPNGMYAEIKYDGERVQLHKKGNEFVYYSRALKPVLPHKVNHFKEFIPKAFPRGEDLILDSEVLLIDTETSKPLPFGSLGVHKKSEFKDAKVCLFVFDCIYYNGESLMRKTMQERKEILKKVMVEVPNRVLFSEYEEVTRPEDLNAMMEKVFRLGLEGLVLKDFAGPYEPGKRHWLKVKKDYLFGGAMADTADLVVLGAWYGTGQKGGMMSIFLMGCYDPDSGKWCTVTKVHGGHDDETLKRLQTELKMVKISRDSSRIPSWLKANKSMHPDFVAQNPKESPVWEITGAEFTQNEVHTADGISVRFPRVTRIRDDKTWEQATSLPELRAIFKKSKQTSDFTLQGMSGIATSPSKTASPSKRSLHSNDGSQSSGSGADTKKPRKQGTLDAFIKSPVRDRSPESPIGKKSSGPKKPLPDVFCDVRLSLPSELPDEESFTLKRYFVGYGGTLLAESKASSATHVLHCGHKKRGVPTSDGATHVDIEWLWSSIRRQKLLDPRGYAL